jgi:bla regulator protein BlaR1
MLAWMLYVIFITLLLGGAALAAERAAVLRRARTRWIWTLAILASLAIPTVIASVSIQLPSLLIPTVTRKITALREVTAIRVAPLTWVREQSSQSSVMRSLNLMLPSFWALASAGLFAVLVLNGAYVSWRTRRWWMGTLAGARVYIAPDVGPGVVGLLRPRIVAPRWLTETPSACQELVIAHEQAHLARHDPQVLTLALFLLVIMPWNVPLWWQLHRLRRAIEVDCDARVLEKGLDPEKYRQMLTDVSRRPSAYMGMVAAMSESPSLLQQRMRLMVDPAQRGPVAAPMLVVLAFALVAVAAQVTPPNVGNAADGELHALILAPEVLDRYVGFYVRRGHEVTQISRQGSHLFMDGVELSDRVELIAESETDFRFTIEAGLHETFLLDERGQVTGLLAHNDRPKFALLCPRVDASTAQQIRADNRVRFQSQTRMPGSEAALLRMLDGVLKGKCIDEVAPWLKSGCEETMSDLHWERIYASWGAVQSVKFLRVEEEGGMDVYEIRQERGRSEWGIYLDANGVIQDYDDRRTGQ